MSINPQLHEDVVPYLVSPYENFFFLIQHVKLTVESGKCVALRCAASAAVVAIVVVSAGVMRVRSNGAVRVVNNLIENSGYPGQGGCFYGHEGRCYVSQYRMVYVSNTEGYTAYRSFSLPFYCIHDWKFHVSIFGAKSWRGHVNPVPGGGLISVGSFTLDFLSFGFEEFRSHILPLLESSRQVHQRFVELSQPSVLMVPAKIVDPNERTRRVAYYAAEDPLTLFVVDSSSEKEEPSSSSSSP